MINDKVFVVRRARIVSVCLFVAAIVLGITKSPWWLLSVPFVVIGALFSAPNLNLINGMPSYLSMVTGLILMRFHGPSGAAVFLGAAAGFYGSVGNARFREASRER